MSRSASKRSSSASVPAPYTFEEHLPHHVSNRPYSLSRALASAANAKPGRHPDGLEGEVSQEIARRFGKPSKGFWLPHDAIQSRALDKSAGVGSIPTLIPEGTFVDALRAKMVVGLAGGRFVTLNDGSGSPTSIPKKTSATTVAWTGEGSAPTQSNLVTTPIALSPKTLAAWTDLTRPMWRSSTPAFDQFVFDDMATSIAVELDRVALNGAGGNEPTGVLGWSGIPVFALGANGAAITRANIVEMERLIGNANGDAGADASLAFVTTPNGRAKLRLTDASTGNAGRFLWADDDFLLNTPAYATKNLPNNLTKGSGTNLSAAVFGDWRALIVNLFGAIDVVVDPFKFSTAGCLRLVCYQEADVACTTPESFQVVRDFLTT